MLFRIIFVLLAVIACACAPVQAQEKIPEFVKERVAFNSGFNATFIKDHVENICWGVISLGKLKSNFIAYQITTKDLIEANLASDTAGLPMMYRICIEIDTSLTEPDIPQPMWDSWTFDVFGENRTAIRVILEFRQLEKCSLEVKVGKVTEVLVTLRSDATVQYFTNFE